MFLRVRLQRISVKLNRDDARYKTYFAVNSPHHPCEEKSAHSMHAKRIRSHSDLNATELYILQITSVKENTRFTRESMCVPSKARQSTKHCTSQYGKTRLMIRVSLPQKRSIQYHWYSLGRQSHPRISRWPN